MTKTFSVAEAKNKLSSLIHQVEEDGPVELTRRGRPVAMVISLDDYQRLQGPRPDILEVVSSLRADLEREDLELDPDEIFGSVRSRETGREISWQ